LIPWEKEHIQLIPLTGMDKFMALKKQTYRFNFTGGLEKEVSHFQHAGVIGGSVPVTRVGRPKEPFLLDRLIDVLETDFLK
ncbi:MAG: tail fiber domain-containing protein, partial [bacterium]|nr:tail fiber domain-containing protein [bacterium]